MDERAFSRAAALRFGWDATKKNVGLFVALALVTILVSLFFSGAEQRVAEMRSLLALVVLLSDIASIVLSMVWTRVGLDVVDGRPVRFWPEGPESWRRVARYVAATILYSLAVCVGLLFFIVPGIYLAVRYALYGFLVVDKGLEPFETFRESTALTEGSRWNLFVLGLAFFGINLAGALLCGVGLLVTMPITTLAAAYVYRRLEARAPTRQPNVLPMQPTPAPTA